jgi:transposase
MADPVRADYKQQLLLPPSLEDWVAAEHPARFIRDFVDSLDLKELGFRVPACRTGRPPFAADLLLKVLLYGFFEKIRSFRRLEWSCYNVLAVVWLTGRHYPDHNTIWRFWDANRDVMRGVSAQVVRVAHKVGLVGMALHAVDGTKVASALSRRGAWHRRGLEKLLGEAVGEIEEEMAAAWASEQGEPGYAMSEELQDALKRKELIERALGELDAAGTDHLHPGDTEARMMKCGRVKDLAYNAQAVVDSESGLIVASDVTSEGSDAHELGGMLDEVEEALEGTAEQTVADGGYWSPEEVAAAEESARGVVVRAPSSVTGEREGDGPYHKARFAYEAERDVFVCPQGKELDLRGTKPGRHDKEKEVRVYRCRSYRDCPVRWECSGAKRGRTIEKGPHHEAVVRQVEKQKGEEGSALLAKRSQIVEAVFGILKAGHRFRRWSVRGLGKVRAEWTLMCTVLNLRKLYGHWLEGRLRWGDGADAARMPPTG